MNYGKRFLKHPVACLTGTRGLDILALVVIFSFGVSLGLGLLVPVYTDEVATKLMQARFLAEGGKLLSLFPQCLSGVVLEAPLSWYPAAFVYSIIYSGLMPLGLRVSGVVLALAALVAATCCLWLTLPACQSRLRTLAACAAVLGLGVLPLTLVLARSEQWLVFLLIAFLLVVLLAGRAALQRRIRHSVLLLGLFVLMAALFSFSHSKALFFMPFVVVSAWLIFRTHNKAFLVAAIAFALFSGFQSYQFAKTVIACEDAPILSGILASQTTRLALLVESPIVFLGEVVGNIASAPRKMFAHLLFLQSHQSGWLPAMPDIRLGGVVGLVNRGMQIVFFAVYWLTVVLPPLVFAAVVRKGAAGGLSILFAALWIGLVGHLGLYREWNFYGAALVLPVMCLLLVPSFLQLSGLFGKIRFPGWLTVPLMILSLASFSVLTFRVVPLLMDRTGASPEALQGQPLSVNAYAFASARERVRNLSMACGLKGDGAKRLVVDDLTYLAFEDLREPLHAVYLYQGGFGADIGDRIRDFLKRLESDGVVAQCTYLSPQLLVDAVRDGNLCCIDLHAEPIRPGGAPQPANAESR